jgi:myo-inositol-1(or 4)-monophosphatase
MKDFLLDLIKRAGDLTLEYRTRLGNIAIDRKSDKDIVTEADKAVEDFIINVIRARFPDHAILGEETGRTDGNEFCWIIDPIDGTSSFVHGQPYYSVSIALQQNGTTILGAVNIPVLKDIFYAEKGKGATRNGIPVHVSDRDQLVNCHLATGFACLRCNLERNNLPYLSEIAPIIREVRMYGSAAADLCYVASGVLDGFWQLNLKAYDVAAGCIILEEAGGKVTDFTDSSERLDDEILATNGCIHSSIVDIFMSVNKRCC